MEPCARGLRAVLVEDKSCRAQTRPIGKSRA
jgi:hypothetical protein